MGGSYAYKNAEKQNYQKVLFNRLMSSQKKPQQRAELITCCLITVRFTVMQTVSGLSYLPVLAADVCFY